MSIDVVHRDSKMWDRFPDEKVIAENLKPRAGGSAGKERCVMEGGKEEWKPVGPEWVELAFSYKGSKHPTGFLVRMHPASFQALAETMMKVDRDAAIRAFGVALAGLPASDEKSKAA